MRLRLVEARLRTLREWPISGQVKRHKGQDEKVGHYLGEGASMKLYEHELHPHAIYNANRRHEREQAQGGFNTKFAIAITRGMGTMVCAYVFAALALFGFPGFHSTVPQYVQWISQTFIQLTALSVLAVGQNVLGRKQEIQAEEQFKTTQNSFHDIEEIVHHLDMQDQKIIETLDGIHALSEQLALLAYLQDKKPSLARKKTGVATLNGRNV